MPRSRLPARDCCRMQAGSNGRAGKRPTRSGRSQVATIASFAASLWWRKVDIDFESGEVRKDGSPVSLAGKELQLLRYLIDHRGKVVSPDEPLESGRQTPPAPPVPHRAPRQGGLPRRAARERVAISIGRLIAYYRRARGLAAPEARGQRTEPQAPSHGARCGLSGF